MPLTNTVKYIVTTQPITDSNSPVTVDNEGTEGDYVLDMLEIYYNLLDAERNTCHFRLVEKDLFNSKVSTDFKGGDIIQVYEAPDSTARLIPVFVGYIKSVSSGFQQGQNAIDISCGSILSQWCHQSVIQSSASIAAFQTQGVSNNIVKLGTILDLYATESLVSLAYIGQQFLYQDPIGKLANNPVNASTDVWCYLSPTDNRFNSVSQILYPYMRCIYQRPDGQIVIGFMSNGSENQDSDYSIDVTNSYPSVPYQMLSIRDNSGSVVNRTLENWAGMNYLLSTTESTIVQAMAQPGPLFARPRALLDSGVFTTQLTDTQSFSQSMAFDPALINLMNIMSPNGKDYNLMNDPLIPDVGNNNSTESIIGIYAARMLAAQLSIETLVSCTSARVFTAGKDFPLGKIIKVHAPNYTDATQMLCVGGKIQYYTQQTIVTVDLVKPYTFIPVWDN
jgi:hypothetical protein